MQDLIFLAEKVAEAQLRVDSLGMANTPVDVTERIKMDARYKIAQANLESANKVYQECLNSKTPEELSTIAKAPNDKT